MKYDMRFWTIWYTIVLFIIGLILPIEATILFGVMAYSFVILRTLYAMSKKLDEIEKRLDR